MENKTAGIVCDNYKIEKFKEELIKKGFKDFEVIAFVGNTSTIKVKAESDKLPEIKKICEEVELHFRVMKN